MNINTFIVEDEKPAREFLRELLEQIDGVEVVGEAADGNSALSKIKETRPQLVFLDINLPGMNGLELASDLNKLPHKPLLVVATAHKEYAHPAFDEDAIDFLHKPFTQERVTKAVAKAAKALPAEAALCRRIFLYDSKGVIILISPDQIFYIRSEDGWVFAHTVKGDYDTRSTLDILEQKLATSGFFRTHRSYLANLNHVCKVIRLDKSCLDLIMDDSQYSKVPVSRNNVKDVLAALEGKYTV